MRNHLKNEKLLASAVSRLEKLHLLDCFDPINPQSRATPAQADVLADINTVAYRFVTAGNQSGKSQLAAREAAWVFTETHPFWERPESWGAEPLLMLIVARVGKQSDDVLWRKIRGFLDPAEYTAKYGGGHILEKVINKKNGNTMLFFSHHSPDEAREKLQAFVAHYVWLDELPRSYRLVEELQRRVQAKRGPFLATFTPKDVNIEVQRLVDALRPPTGKKYQFHMFDNPIYNETDKVRILDSMATYSETYRNTLLKGDWMTGSEQVYYFNYDQMVQDLPAHYSPSWRHMESVDPALKSALGLTVWGEDPTTHRWYCVLAEYVKGVYVPTELVAKVKDMTKSFNIVKRVCDPHESWYIHTAASMGIAYDTVYNKNDRKPELIKGLQEKLGGRLVLTPRAQELITEFNDCRWSAVAEQKIVNSSSYHLLDSAQYFADTMPRPAVQQLSLPFHDYLYRENEKRKIAISKKNQSRQRIQRGGSRRAWQ